MRSSTNMRLARKQMLTAQFLRYVLHAFYSKAFYARPYTFIGLGVFCLMCNMMAMTHLSYLIRQFKQIRFNESVDQG